MPALPPRERLPQPSFIFAAHKSVDDDELLCETGAYRAEVIRAPSVNARNLIILLNRLHRPRQPVAFGGRGIDSPDAALGSRSVVGAVIECSARYWQSAAAEFHWPLLPE